MSRLAVIFPGIGYTADKPLLHCSRRLAERAGYEIKVIPYKGFPKKVKGDKDKMRKSCEIALEQAEKEFKDIDLDAYSDILFIGKSIGTVVAADIAAHSNASSNIRFIIYTPLEATFSYPLGSAIVFTGSADPWTGAEESRIAEICAQRDIPCYVTEGANHSLETADPLQDIASLQLIMQRTEAFIREKQLRRITFYEELLNRLLYANTDTNITPDELKAMRSDAETLANYYGSEEWKADLADDEAGMLPFDLKRGVLSEDGIYNALEDYKQLTRHYTV